MKDSTISIEGMRSIASLTYYGDGRYMKDEQLVRIFGAAADVMCTLWRLIIPHLDSESEPHHMMWWLFNCKHYPTKELLQKAIGVSPPTARKFMRPIKKAIFAIRSKVVSRK
jgi:hypothetical protein